MTEELKSITETLEEKGLFDSIGRAHTARIASISKFGECASLDGLFLVSEIIETIYSTLWSQITLCFAPFENEELRQKGHKLLEHRLKIFHATCEMLLEKQKDSQTH